MQLKYKIPYPHDTYYFRNEDRYFIIVEKICHYAFWPSRSPFTFIGGIIFRPNELETLSKGIKIKLCN